MHNCFVMGSGRSGTSMVAGTLSQAGYFMGEDIIKPTASNPKGYYESAQVEAINESLLLPIVPRNHGGLPGKLLRRRPGRFQLWLACVPVGQRIPCDQSLAGRIQAAVKQQPFCFKDPRFCYTLPAWRPYLRDMVFVCVFREPAVTAESVLKNCRDEPYLKTLPMTFQQALEVWTLMYRHILSIHRHEGSWLFLHYNQVLRGDGLDRLASFVDAPVDRSFPDRSLKRSFSQRRVPMAARRVYRELCELAGYDGSAQGGRGQPAKESPVNSGQAGSGR
ncbi:MAG TPA: hypothetical protein VL171_08955 [Verrucomicrobiae bacterium]|nr:hypothetical protein [Verrucomicrobiae bacterium]